MRISDWSSDVCSSDLVVAGGRLTKMLSFQGLKRVPIEEAAAGDIVAIAGLADATVADTICATEFPAPLESQPNDPPTLAMTLSVNDSPQAVREGDNVTSRMSSDRPMGAADGTGAFPSTETADQAALEVDWLGELTPPVAAK